MNKHILTKAFLPALLSVSSLSHGADFFWGGNLDASFGTADNWFSDLEHTTGAGVIPGAGDVAILNADGTINFQVASLGGAQSLLGLRYNANATTGITITDTAALTLGASGITVDGSGAHTLAAPVIVGAVQTWNNTSGNVYAVTGSTTLSANMTLNGNSDWAFSGPLINSGANRTLTINGTGLRTFGNVNLSESNTARTFSMNVITDAEITGEVANGGTGNGNLSKNGAGTLTLSGVNTFGGTLNISAGAVNVTSSNATRNPGLNFNSTTGGAGVLNLGTGVAYRVGTVTVNAGSGGGLITGAGSIALNADRTFAVGDTPEAIDLQTDVPITNGDGNRRVTKTLGGTWVSNAANTFSNSLQLQGGTTVWNVTNTNTGGGLIFNASFGTEPTRLTVGAGAQFQMPGNLTMNSNVTNGAIIEGPGALGIHGGDRAIIVNDTAAFDDLVISAVIQNSASETGTNRGIRKEGSGRLILTADNTYTGVTDLTRGVTVFDYSTNNGSKIADTSAFTFRGGDAVFNGNGSAPTLEIINGTTSIGAGSSIVRVVANGGQTATVQFGNFTRNIGQGVLDFQMSDANASVGSTAVNGPFGFIGGHITFGGDRWAFNDGSNVLAGLEGTHQNDSSLWQTGQNLIVDGMLTGTLKTTAIDSLIFDSAQANTLNLNMPGGSLTVRSGAILVSDDVGTETTVIGAGSLSVSGPLAADSALLLTNRSAGLFRIEASLGTSNAPISANVTVTTAGNSDLGTGVIELAGRNFYGGQTYIQGRMRIEGGNALPDFSTLIMGNAGGSQLDLNGNSETVANLQGGSFQGINGTEQIILGSGTLTVNNTGNTTYSGTMVGEGNLVKNGPGTLFSNSNALTFTGELQVLGGLLDFTGNNGGATAASLILIRGGSILAEQNQGASIDKLGNNTPIRMEGTTGNGLRVVSNQNGTRTENSLELQLAAGSNVITMENTATTTTIAATVLAFTNATDSFVRSNQATILFRAGTPDMGGTGVPETARITFVNGIDDTLIGGGGGIGSTSISILPFAVGGVGSVSNPGDTFVTVGANGIRPLAVGEYATNYATALAVDNLSQDATSAGLGTATFNALRIDNSAADVDLIGVGGGSNTLTLASGALLVSAGANTNDSTISGFDQILAGANDATPDELIIHTTSSNVAGSGASLTIASSIVDHGAAATSLTKSGAGTLVLTGTNTYTGETTINQGAISFATGASLGSDGPIRLAGGQLTWAAGNTTDISSKADTSARSVELAGSSVWLGFGNKILNAGNTFDVGENNVTLAHSVGNGGVGSLTKAGTGTLTLTQSPNYTGPTLISAGSMEFAGGIAPGTTPGLYLVAPSGTMSATVSNGLFLQSLIVGGIYEGTGNATGTVTATGPVIIGDGSGDDVIFLGYRDNSAGDGAGGNTIGVADFSGASSVNIDVTRILMGHNRPGGANGIEGDLTLSNGTNVITANAIIMGNSPGPGNTALISTLHTGTGVTAINTDTLLIGGQKSKGAVTVGAGGMLFLRGLTGGNSGADIFIADNDNSATGTVATGVLNTAGGMADIIANRLVIGRHGAGAGAGQGQLIFTAGTVQASSVELAITDFRGSSTADANTTGSITQTGGTFRFGTLRQGGGTATYTVNGGTIANVSGMPMHNENVQVTLAGASQNIDIEGGQTGVFDAGAKFTGPGSLAKTGSGTLILAGANDHLGGTSVVSGALLVTGSITGSPVSVNSGGTLGGTGSISTAVVVNTGGTVAPGLSAGQLDTGDFMLSTGSTLSIEIGGLVAGTSYDQLNVTGTLTLGGTLSVSLLGGFTPAENDIFVIALNDNLGDDSVFDTFTDLPQGGTFEVGEFQFAVDYAYNADAGAVGNDVALVVIPEPSAMISLLGGVGCLLGLRRRRN